MMANPTSIVNPAGDSVELILYYANRLGKDKIRRQIFDIVYGRGQRAKSKRQVMHAAGIPSAKGQQVQNALDHLSKYHLISKVENDGLVKDGSRYLYGKLQTVRAHRREIEQYADDPKSAARVATKRQPIASSLTITRQITKQELKKRKRLVVLYMLANPDLGPDPSKHIRPEAEARMVQEAVRGSKFSDSVAIEIRVAANLSTMLNGLNDLSPQIVHFSGHSNANGLAVDSGAVSGPAKQSLSYDLFSKALEATDDKPVVVVLNSCLSAAARRRVLNSAQAMVGMVASISDVAAAAFAQQFYAALASGQSLASAFKQGVVAVEASSLTEKATPQLFVRAGVEAAKLVLT